jgi:hypothetical protein
LYLAVDVGCGLGRSRAAEAGARRGPMMDRGLRAAAITGSAAAAAVGLAMPGSLLLGGCAWLVFLFFACSGWGYLLLRAARVEDVDFGLRATLGAAGAIALGGGLLALGIADRTALLALLGLGWAGAAWREWRTPAPLWRAGRGGWTAAVQRPALAVLVAALVAAALFRMIGGIVSLERNIWDDDIAYLPLLQRLLQLGDLTEPFSFRRLGAYGGQFLLQGFGAARGTLLNFHIIDKGLCFGLTLLLLVGMARRGGGAKAVPLVLMALTVLMLPDVGINTASHWSGVMLLVALYRSMVGADAAAESGDRTKALRWLALAALTGAAACTLRQNYLAVVALFFAFALVARLRSAAQVHGWAGAWKAERSWWGIAVGVGVLVLLPWWIAMYTSNGTFLFPFVPGTWNQGLTLRPTAVTWMQEVQFMILLAVESEPLNVVLPLALLLLFTRDRRASRPLGALFFATVASFLVLVHSFVGADIASLWRYLFASGMSLTALLILEIGDGDAARPVQAPLLGRWCLVAVLLLQFLDSRELVSKTYATLVDGVREVVSLGRRGDPETLAERARYRAMQAAIPEGEKVAVMVDDAANLDYRRNPISNLDLPGFSSPGGAGAQWPSFVGPEAVRRYFLAQGYRYLAFVRPDFSRYLYRRWYWLRELYIDDELFQVIAAYMLDALESFTALAETREPLHDVDGLVVLDLGELAPGGAAAPHRPELEAQRRSAWTRQLAERLNLRRAWELNTRDDLVFDDGFSRLVFVTSFLNEDVPPAPRLQTKADALADPHVTVPLGTPTRWMHRRAHLRLRGDRDMRLRLHGQVRREVTGTRPRLAVSLDGELLASMVVAEDGTFIIDLPIAAARVRDWADLYVVFSSVGLPERESRELRFARLDGVEWEPQ